ncbi:hypothetical protein N474_01085 [Pseudoalteromonas luteoviolacea CPMOR-2]|uniref:Carrier domain-containing protein n=2 Tax=Pseudoalteromonas luteoviolacea TaxID=43657 RepID=A0A166XMK4_9GAMM|nr:hypothetical protein N475_11490 [Pseudoalteromonas luteoviolacea DSM 6061]KZN55558.1 hypothetical protein N474_01085 [Pseudoalteromonas luteoviolacea CPMOR-2]
MNNLGGAAIYRGEKDLPALNMAVNRLLANNSVFRLRYQWVDMEHKQYVAGYSEQTFDVVDLSNSDDPQHALNCWMDNFASLPLDFDQGPLYDIKLIKLPDGIGFYIKLHHFIADGWTFLKISEKIADGYLRLSRMPTGMPSDDSPELKLGEDYRLAVTQEAEYLLSDRFAKDQSYWHKKYATLPNLSGYSRPYKNKDATRGSRLSRPFTVELSRRLELRAEQLGCSVNTLVVATSTLMMNKRLGLSDITVGVPVFNRTSRTTRAMAGMFTSTMASRFEVDNQQTTDIFIGYVEKQLRQDLRHQKYPYDQLVQDLGLAQHQQDGLFGLSVNCYNTRNLESISDIIIENDERYSGHQAYDLQFIVKPQAGSSVYQLDVDHKLCCYSDTQVSQMADQFFAVLEQLLVSEVDGRKTLSEVTLLSPDLRDYVINGFNQRQQDYPANKSIIDLVSAQCNATPDRIALQAPSSQYSYDELEQAILKMAGLLQSKGIEKGDVVAIIAPPSSELVISILAVLKCGAVYCPIDIATPNGRIDYMLNHAEAKLVLDMSDQDLATAVETLPLALTIARQVKEPIFQQQQWPSVAGQDPAYIIFTSGSTGHPKGVLVHHQGVVNYISWASKTYLLGEQDAMAFYSSPAFDLTVTSIFSPLICGAKVVVYGAVENGFVLFDILKDNQCTVLKLTPAHLNLIKTMTLQDSKIHSLILGGEALNRQLAAQVCSAFGDGLRLFNEYGPTETVVGSMTYLFDPQHDADNEANTIVDVAIGVPIANTAIYILDDDLQPTAPGQQGELYIAGDGVTLGYLNSPELSEKAFLPNPFAVGERMYRTGDQAFFDGSVIHYLGRNDSQIKVNGYRIECGEIEAQLRRHDQVDDAKVVLKQINAHSTQLCAYVTGGGDECFDGETYLAAFFPKYMIPSHFVRLTALPLTHNGKVDIKALLDVELEQAAIEEAPAVVDAVVASKAAQALLDAAAKVLQLPGISLEQHFIHLGGDSIKAIQLSTLLQERGFGLNVQTIMTQGRFSEILNEVELLSVSGHVNQQPAQGEIVASPIMHWYMNQEQPQASHYNQCLTLRLKSYFSKEHVEEALNFMINYHDMFRLNYSSEESTYEYNAALVGKTLSLTEFNPSLDFRADSESLRRLTSSLSKQIDLQNGWLLAAGWYCDSDANYLILCAHHFAVDGISWRILVEQLCELLHQLQAGQACALAPKTCSYADWSAQLSRSGSFHEEVGFWQAQLDQEQTLVTQISDGTDTDHLVQWQKKLHVTLDRHTTNSLLSSANKSFSTTPQELLLAALSQALAEVDVSQSTNQVIDLETHGRQGFETELAGTIGWFTAIYPLSLPMQSCDLASRVKLVKESCRQIPNDGIGFGVLHHLEGLLTGGVQRRIRFNYLGDFDQMLTNEQLSIVDFHLSQHPKQRLSSLMDFALVIKDQQLVIELSFSERVQNTENMSDLLTRYQQCITDLAKFCDEQTSVEFTPSDFSTADLDYDDLEALFE